MLMLAQNSGEFCYLNPPGPLLQRGNPNLAEGDPLPIFLKSFYNNEVGKEAPEAREGSLAPFFRARSRSGHKIAENYESTG
jgi:hypothetical protein